MDCSCAEFITIDEGLCVQMMHIGSFDDEPASVALMNKYIEEQSIFFLIEAVSTAHSKSFLVIKSGKRITEIQLKVD